MEILQHKDMITVCQVKLNQPRLWSLHNHNVRRVAKEMQTTILLHLLFAADVLDLQVDREIFGQEVEALVIDGSEKQQLQQELIKHLLVLDSVKLYHNRLPFCFTFQQALQACHDFVYIEDATQREVLQLSSLCLRMIGYPECLAVASSLRMDDVHSLHLIYELSILKGACILILPHKLEALMVL